MKLVWKKNFHDIFKQYEKEKDYSSLLHRMSALEVLRLRGLVCPLKRLS